MNQRIKDKIDWWKWRIAVAICFALIWVGGCIYIATHFIIKYW